MPVPAILSTLLAQFGPEALDFVLTHGKDYVITILDGKELSEEEKDKFYGIIDAAKRMQDSK